MGCTAVILGEDITRMPGVDALILIVKITTLNYLSDW